jgi:hypothetical protein
VKNCKGVSYKLEQRKYHLVHGLERSKKYRSFYAWKCREKIVYIRRMQYMLHSKYGVVAASTFPKFHFLSKSVDKRFSDFRFSGNEIRNCFLEKKSVTISL